MTDVFTHVLHGWPIAAQERFHQIRQLVLRTAQDIDAGPIEESLKWGQPAWRPKRSGQGITLRLNWHPEASDTLAFFVDCKSSLAGQMLEAYPIEFEYENNRGMRFSITDNTIDPAIIDLATRTFTYRRKT